MANTGVEGERKRKEERGKGGLEVWRGGREGGGRGVGRGGRGGGGGGGWGGGH